MDGRSPPLQADVLGRLTDQEQQVALAVGAGLSNRQAAAGLFCSPKTVECHLGRIFVKLHVSTRTQLAVLIARATTPDPRCPHCGGEITRSAVTAFS